MGGKSLSKASISILTLILFGLGVVGQDPDAYGEGGASESTTEGGAEGGGRSSAVDPTNIVPSSVQDDPDFNCSSVTMDSPWEDQIKIYPCHFVTHTHPRQIPRKRRTEDEEEDFHHLALFSIKNNQDMQEAGEKCSVELHQEWLLDKAPVMLKNFSYNRIWYKRLCNFFSFLECIPDTQMRFESKETMDDPEEEVTPNSAHLQHKHPGALRDKHSHLPIETTTGKSGEHTEETTEKPKPPREFKPLLTYEGNNRSTSGLQRRKIGGRGPGKTRIKSGSDAERVEPMPEREAIEVDGYPLNGICACSQMDPKYPNRSRLDYGMDFVEDDSRNNWCVAAPGNLCGRVYFRKNLWPGQNFEMSDHIGCPKLYQGEEYECVKWKYAVGDEEQAVALEHTGEAPNTETSTCEKKELDEDEKKDENAPGGSIQLCQFTRIIVLALIFYIWIVY